MRTSIRRYLFRIDKYIKWLKYEGINRRANTEADVVHINLTLVWLTSDLVLKMATQSRDINTNGFTLTQKYLTT